MIPASEVAAVKRFCDERIPPDLVEQIRLEVVEGAVALTIAERRPPGREDLGPEWTSSDIARLRYVATKKLWTLYEPHSDGRWHRYPFIGPTPTVEPLLAEIDRGSHRHLLGLIPQRLGSDEYDL